MSWLTVGVGGASLLAGGIQSIIGGGKEKRATNAIENLQTPTYNPNASIIDYYNKALQRYNTNPYQSAEYQAGIQQGDRNTAAGINALQDRGGAIGGISRLIALQNQNALNQGITATREQDARFGQLGQAANMRANEDRYGFQINKLMPYQKQLDLLTSKARGGAQMLNSGFSNIFNGLGTAALGFSGANNTGSKIPALTNSFSPIDMNAITGGLNGNWGTLQAGSPFADNTQDYTTNPLGG